MADSESDYKVGPGRPPLHTRFKKGQSGNPGGRSAKSLPALLADALNETVVVTIDERGGKITKRKRSSRRWSTNRRAPSARDQHAEIRVAAAAADPAGARRTQGDRGPRITLPAPCSTRLGSKRRRKSGLRIPP